MAFFKKTSKETKAYRNILKKKTDLAERQAYADEAIKVAGERARMKARRKPIGDIIADRFRGSVESRVSGTRTQRAKVVRRITPKAKVVRRITPRIKRRVVKKTVTRKAPRTRVVRRKTVRKQTVQTTQAPRQAQTLNEAMYGGY